MNLQDRSATFIQENCTEGDKVDPRQSEVVAQYKPDIIIFEYPAGQDGPGLVFNDHPCSHKPLREVNRIKRWLHKAAESFPYAYSDILVWEKIEDLWAQGHEVKLYNVDAPAEVRREHYYHFPGTYEESKDDWLFQAFMYVRESYMHSNWKTALAPYDDQTDLTVAVFLQSLHWQGVSFLDSGPSKEEIWSYYFGSVSAPRPETITQRIKERSPVLYNYWPVGFNGPRESV